MSISDRCHRLIAWQPIHRLVAMVRATKRLALTSTNQNPSGLRRFWSEDYIRVMR
jgi:hypothetical protein